MALDKPPGIWHTEVTVVRSESLVSAAPRPLATRSSRPVPATAEDSFGYSAWGYGSAWDEDCYSHWGGEYEEWPVARCRNGASCRFLALGTCEYYHPEEEMEGATSTVEWTQASERGPRWNVWVNNKAPEPPAIVEATDAETKQPRDRSRSRSAKGKRHGSPQVERQIATPLRARLTAVPGSR
eukprot:gb/GFBE01010686.1/.p1 GENE.gb/GFBE01010686.1/~~gb/GFBE01010686.1/.p1  ORF type:complete len:183 (+),score=20.80 gb/GFBE01010686.1/:1-549(+)